MDSKELNTVEGYEFVGGLRLDDAMFRSKRHPAEQAEPHACASQVHPYCAACLQRRPSQAHRFPVPIPPRLGSLHGTRWNQPPEGGTVRQDPERAADRQVHPGGCVRRGSRRTSRSYATNREKRKLDPEAPDAQGRRGVILSLGALDGERAGGGRESCDKPYAAALQPRHRCVSLSGCHVLR